MKIATDFGAPKHDGIHNMGGGRPVDERNPLLHECSACGAKPYERCSERRTGSSFTRYLSRPHRDRRNPGGARIVPIKERNRVLRRDNALTPQERQAAAQAWKECAERKWGKNGRHGVRVGSAS